MPEHFRVKECKDDSSRQDWWRPCRLSIVFGLGRDSAVQQSRHIAAVDPYVIKEEALTQTQHGQYMPVPEQFESWTQDLMSLPQQEAYVKLHNQPAVKIKTLAVPDAQPNRGELDQIRAHYKERYQRTRAEAEAAGVTLQTTATAPRPSKDPFTLFSAQESSAEED